jgi:hypothetical protein
VHQIVIEEGDDKDVSFTFVKIGPGRIDVSVKNLEGTPIEETKVFLYGPFGDLAEKVVGSTGSVSFDPVSFGNKGIRIVPPQLYLDGDDSFFYKDALLIDEGWREEVSFVLDKCLGTLRASVQDVSGAPVPDYPIRLYSVKENLGVKQTETDGIAVFDSINCGNRGLALVETTDWIFEEGRDLSFYDGIFVKRGTDQTFSFNVEFCRGILRADVSDPSGVPVPDYPVRLYSAEETLEIKKTETDGIAVFDSISCGDRGLALVEKSGWIFEEGRDLSFYDGISVTPQSDQTFSFNVEICLGTLRASVQNASGVAVMGYPVRLYSSTENLDEKETGSDGVAVFDSISCGDRALSLVKRPGWVFEEGRDISFYDGISVTLQSNQTFSFGVTSCSGQISVRVEDQNGNPVSGALLELYAANRTWDERVTGATGSLAFSGACGMDIGVKVTPPSGYTVTQGRGLSFFDSLRPDLNGPAELVFRLQATQD